MFILTYKFICLEKGYSANYVIINETFNLVISIIADYFGGIFLKNGYLQRLFIISNAFNILAAIASFIVYLKYSGPSDDIFLLVASMLINVIFFYKETTYLYNEAFIYSIADPLVGGVFISFTSCVGIAFELVPETVGLYIVKYFDHKLFMALCIGLSIIVYPATYWIALKIDMVDVLEYRLFKPGEIKDDHEDFTNRQLEQMSPGK